MFQLYNLGPRPTQYNVEQHENKNVLCEKVRIWNGAVAYYFNMRHGLWPKQTKKNHKSDHARQPGACLRFDRGTAQIQVQSSSLPKTNPSSKLKNPLEHRKYIISLQRSVVTISTTRFNIEWICSLPKECIYGLILLYKIIISLTTLTDWARNGDGFVFSLRQGLNF